MNQPAVVHYCKVCGQPVDPAVDILFGVAGKGLFAAHKGPCADLVRSGAQLVGNTLRGLLALKAPRVAAVLDTIVAAAKHEPPA